MTSPDGAGEITIETLGVVTSVEGIGVGRRAPVGTTSGNLVLLNFVTTRTFTTRALIRMRINVNYALLAN